MMPTEAKYEHHMGRVHLTQSLLLLKMTSSVLVRISVYALTFRALLKYLV
jgi:hypothetical protein